MACQLYTFVFKKTKNTLLRIASLFLTALLFIFFPPMLNLASGQSPEFVVPCQIQTYGDAWDGVITFGLFNTTGGPFTFTVYNSYLVVMKTNGSLLSLRQARGLNYLVVKVMSPNSLMFQGEPDQTTHFWNFTSNSTVDFPNVYGHHDVEYNPVNKTFLNLRNYVRTVNGSRILFDKIVEEDEGGNILWSWDTYGHISLSDADLCNHVGEANGTALIDFTHANAIQWDYNNSVVYLNVRHTNTFYKINMTSGNIIWGCGEHGNFALLDPKGKNVTSLWYHSHATRQIAPDVFTMFDNDFDNVSNPDDCRSRMIEVTLNETSMTAWVSWSWKAPPQLWSPYFGKTDRLPNGDRIGVFGPPSHQFPQNAPWTGNDTGAVIVEVTSEGSIVRTWTFPTGWSIYRIDEIAGQSKQIPLFGVEPALLIISIATAVIVSTVLVKRRMLHTKNQGTKHDILFRESS